MLTKTKKSKIVKEHKTSETDTGSASVQIAVLTEQIKELSSHLRKNPKDNHSRRGLLKMVSKRKKLMEWLKREDEKEYKKITKKLGLKTK
ncbi:MAG: 30S ribosomal protein S15 [Candidatus Portnoybacteria bacterium]|nr:30S ribosomal protein S15 [Candidatus Portnoybacteria bacterium]